jgi:hypothetical protein
MPDLLARLYALPDIASALTRPKASSIEVRRANAWEKHLLSDWVQRELWGTVRNP